MAHSNAYDSSCSKTYNQNLSINFDHNLHVTTTTTVDRKKGLAAFSQKNIRNSHTTFCSTLLQLSWTEWEFWSNALARPQSFIFHFSPYKSTNFRRSVGARFRFLQSPLASANHFKRFLSSGTLTHPQKNVGLTERVTAFRCVVFSFTQRHVPVYKLSIFSH